MGGGDDCAYVRACRKGVWRNGSEGLTFFLKMEMEDGTSIEHKVQDFFFFQNNTNNLNNFSGQ